MYNNDKQCKIPTNLSNSKSSIHTQCIHSYITTAAYKHIFYLMQFRKVKYNYVVLNKIKTDRLNNNQRKCKKNSSPRFRKKAGKQLKVKGSSFYATMKNRIIFFR